MRLIPRVGWRCYVLAMAGYFFLVTVGIVILHRPLIIVLGITFLWDVGFAIYWISRHPEVLEEQSQ